MIDPGVDIGHVHLKVADLDRSLAFYEGLLGFEVQTRDWGVFLSAGGYHHHLALNTYFSDGSAPARRTRPACITSRSGIRAARRWPMRSGTLIDAGVPVWQAGYGYALAVYFRDPDDNGVELCWDRPREQWGPERGELDVAAFLAGSEAEERA